MSGSGINTGSFATTGSNAFFGTNTFSGAVSFTGSAPSILSQSFSGSLITNLTDTYTDVAAVQQIVTLTSASYAALASGSLTNPNTLYIVSGSTSGSGGGTTDISSLNAFTASQYVSNSFFATTGSNTFTGDQTLIDNAGNFFTISDASGSMMLVAKGFTSASAHMSASAAGIGNFIFKTNSNTADTIISGSNNLFVNATAPTAGFKRYVGGSGNIALNASNVPEISGSMAFSPTMNNNYFGGNSTTMAMRGPVSSSTYTISGNSILGTVNFGFSAANHAQGLASGVSMTGNQIAGTLTVIANKSNLSSSLTFGNNNLNGGLTLNLNSSSVSMGNNNINDSGLTINNNVSIF